MKIEDFHKRSRNFRVAKIQDNDENFNIYKNDYSGFTLAEVLITLVIVGVIAAITVPVLMNKINDYHFKVAYKKVYSDINQAFQEDIVHNQFPAKNANCYDIDFANYTYNKLKEKFKILKTCENNNAFDCWIQNDVVEGFANVPSPRKSFIDLSGRTWIEHSSMRAIYLVDINGDKKPNQFGKDRWLFAFYNYPVTNQTNDCTINPTKQIRIQPYAFYDYTSQSIWCNHPPCYYKKWLIE